MYKKLTLALWCASLVACGAAPEAPKTTAGKPLLLVADDLLTVLPQSLSQGPVISGSLQPEQRAELRAEVAGVVLQVVHDNGDAVQAGDVLVRLDPTSIRDQLLSAQEAQRAAAVALDQAARQLQRMQSMVDKGLVALETAETAATRHNQAQSDLASAKARVVQAQQQLEKTVVRSPFAGIVGSRSVSGGDTAQIGMQLLSVINPASMRFEGMVAADQVGRVQPGANVAFRVNGFADREFVGKVARVNPIANELTRQVQVLVELDQHGSSLVAGLYAEGRIEVQQREALLVPESALLRDGDAAYVWQLQDGALHKSAVQLGTVDARLGQVELTSGLASGAQVLRHPVGALSEGGKVELALPAATPAAVSNVTAAN